MEGNSPTEGICSTEGAPTEGSSPKPGKARAETIISTRAFLAKPSTFLFDRFTKA